MPSPRGQISEWLCEGSHPICWLPCFPLRLRSEKTLPGQCGFCATKSILCYKNTPCRVFFASRRSPILFHAIRGRSGRCPHAGFSHDKSTLFFFYLLCILCTINVHNTQLNLQLRMLFVPLWRNRINAYRRNALCSCCRSALHPPVFSHCGIAWGTRCHNVTMQHCNHYTSAQPCAYPA